MVETSVKLVRTEKEGRDAIVKLYQTRGAALVLASQRDDSIATQRLLRPKDVASGFKGACLRVYDHKHEFNRRMRAGSIVLQISKDAAVAEIDFRKQTHQHDVPFQTVEAEPSAQPL